MVVVSMLVSQFRARIISLIRVLGAIMGAADLAIPCGFSGSLGLLCVARRRHRREAG